MTLIQTQYSISVLAVNHTLGNILAYDSMVQEPRRPGACQRMLIMLYDLLYEIEKREHYLRIKLCTA